MVEDCVRVETGHIYCRERNRYGAVPSFQLTTVENRQEESHPSPRNKRHVGEKIRRGRSRGSSAKRIILFNEENVLREDFGNGERRNCWCSDGQK